MLSWPQTQLCCYVAMQQADAESSVPWKTATLQSCLQIISLRHETLTRAVPKPSSTSQVALRRIVCIIGP